MKLSTPRISLNPLLMTVILLFVFSLAGAQDRTVSLTAEKNWLALPVKNGAPKKNLELWVNGQKERWFDIELAEDNPDWYAYLDIRRWKGQTMELRLAGPDGVAGALPRIIQSTLDTNSGPLYQETFRGQFHFSPKRGWNNDPNGLVYYQGEYHLFFQHNPYGRQWGNMHWGHAVSKDLVHWKELGIALYPDRLGPQYSGGAVVDVHNTSGLGSKDKPALVLFYTGAETWEQGLAWSTDGRNFQKLERPIVPQINKDNRDPKVIWHEPTSKWVMVLYVEQDDGHYSMQFLTSPDLKNWTETSVYRGGKGGDRYLYECPEFFELPVVGGGGERKWVLTGANSQYAIGTFDGKTFTPEAERMNGQRGRDFYAAQTFSNEPQGRRIEIGWWRTRTDRDHMHFNQSMSIPMEVKLEKLEEGLRLTRTPIEELKSLRKTTHAIGTRHLAPGSENPLAGIRTDLAEIRLELEPGDATQIILNVRGLDLVYNPANSELSIDGVIAHAPLRDGKLDLTLYVDRTGLELFASHGPLFMPVNYNFDPDKQSYSLISKGGAARISRLELYELQSSWE